MKKLNHIFGLFLRGILGSMLLILVLGAFLPRNLGWQESVSGVTIGIDASLVHTELICRSALAGTIGEQFSRPRSSRQAAIPPISASAGETGISTSPPPAGANSSRCAACAPWSPASGASSTSTG